MTFLNDFLFTFVVASIIASHFYSVIASPSFEGRSNLCLVYTEIATGIGVSS